MLHLYTLYVITLRLPVLAYRSLSRTDWLFFPYLACGGFGRQGRIASAVERLPLESRSRSPAISMADLALSHAVPFPGLGTYRRTKSSPQPASVSSSSPHACFPAAPRGATEQCDTTVHSELCMHPAPWAAVLPPQRFDDARAHQERMYSDALERRQHNSITPSIAAQPTRWVASHPSSMQQSLLTRVTSRAGSNRQDTPYAHTTLATPRPPHRSPPQYLLALRSRRV